LYFDSFGLPPPTELNNYVDGNVFYPTGQIQPREEVFCGHLCLFVLKEMQKGKGLHEIINFLVSARIRGFSHKKTPKRT